MQNQYPQQIQNNPFSYQQQYQSRFYNSSRIPTKIQYSNPHRQQIFQDYKIQQPVNNFISQISAPQQIQKSQIQNVPVVQQQYKPKGLVNIGNNCYMNAIFQMLFSIVPFRNAIIELQGRKNKDNNITECLIRLFLEMNSSKLEYVNPREIHHKFIQTHNNFGFGQEDAHEFLLMLFLTLGSENQNLKKTDSGILDDFINFFEGVFKTPQKQTTMEQAWQKNRKIENNIITDFFVGMFVNEIRCKNCDLKQFLYEEFNAISLDFGYQIESCQLNELIQYQFKHQIITNYKCQRCQKEEHQMIQKIVKLPPILIFQLKRFNFQFQAHRINTKIIFPIENLNMSDQCIQVKKESFYDLQTIVHHSGDCNNGHYYATCKYRVGEGSQWYRFDDSLVEEAQLEKRQYDTFGTHTPYMLIYKQKQLF